MAGRLAQNVILMKIKFKGDTYTLKWKAALLGVAVFFLCRWLLIEALSSYPFIVTLISYGILLILSGLITGYFAGEFAEFNTIVVGLIIGVILFAVRIAMNPGLLYTRMLYIILVIPASTIALTYIGGIIQNRLKTGV